MIQAQFVTIERWPTAPTKGRKNAPFRASYPRRLALLERELHHLGARNILIQAHLRPDQIRNDGWPRFGVTPSSPGIIVTFQNRSNESLSFPCDTYASYLDNLYAIALALEALRAVDRYGVTRRGEQYEGWKRLAPPAPEPKLDRRWALEHLAVLAGTEVEALSDAAMIDLAYRAAAKKTHPDSGGSVEDFQLLQEAMRFIRQ